MTCKKTDLTAGFITDKVVTTCFATIVDGTVVQGERTVTPNPADPANPIIEYTLDGAVVPTPDPIFACASCADATPVYVCNTVSVDNFPTEVDRSLVLETGANTNIPAGFKSVTINSTSGVTVLNGNFELGEGRVVSSISFGTDRGNYINELLPAYTLSGGTWQWVGHR